VVYTDSETWAGTLHPAQALRQYRERMAKLVVVGMASNGFTIAEPQALHRRPVIASPDAVCPGAAIPSDNPLRLRATLHRRPVIASPDAVCPGAAIASDKR